MLAKWYNTNAETASQMLHVTDELVREWSSGELTEVDDLENPDIFGAFDEKNKKMGHIELPAPVVNIHYLYGKCPVLPMLLQMERTQLVKVIYYACYLVVDPKDSGLSYKQVLTEKEFESYKDQADLMQGAEAIEAVMKKEQILNVDEIILHTLPVLPLGLRYMKHNGQIGQFSLNMLYRRVLFASRRVEKLTEMHAPSIILRNERRMLQEAADALIDNGARGIPRINADGTVCDSLQEVYDKIVSVKSTKKHPAVPEMDEDGKKTLTAAVETYQAAIRAEAEEDSDTDEPVFVEGAEEEDDIAEEELLNALQPFCEKVLRENFAAYCRSYLDHMISFSSRSVVQAAYAYEPGDDLVSLMVKAVYTSALCFVKKQVMNLKGGN